MTAADRRPQFILIQVLKQNDVFVCDIYSFIRSYCLSVQEKCDTSMYHIFPGHSSSIDIKRAVWSSLVRIVTILLLELSLLISVFFVFIAVMFSCCLFCSSLFLYVFIVYFSFVFCTFVLPHMA